ncbi:MAG: GGDEF domain-containing protein [Lachnospira sp.]|nr:GGDEF domain-containing protein [Lachnospira sp.]
MNITKYNTKTKYAMPLGTMLLKEDLHIALADRYIYRYLDKHADMVFTELIHDEGLQDFHDALGRIDSEGPQYIVVPFLTMEDDYRSMLIRVKRDSREIDGQRCIEVSIADIVKAMEKHAANRANLTKYRRMMCLIDYLFFDYTKKNNNINIYMYANDKSYMFLSEDFDVWKKQMLDGYIWTDDDKKKFETFCVYLKDGLDDFKIQLATTFFSRGGRNDSLVVSGSTLFDANGERMVSGVIKLNAELTETPYYATDAARDSATGLMNKRAIMEYAAYKIEEGKVGNLALMVIDIDNFKNINDEYGHLFGDRVIYKVAETIKKIVSAGGTVARFGGDEFVVLLEKFDKDKQISILKTIYSGLGMLFLGEEKSPNVTISVGVSNYPQDGTSYEELFRKADKALYVAKANGKNNYVVYDEDEHGKIEIMSDASRLKGLKSVSSRVKRSTLYSDIILMLSDKDKDGIVPAMEKVCELYDVAGMCVFVGEELSYYQSYGNYRNIPDRYTLLTKSDFIPFISDDDTVAIEDVKKHKDKSFFENYNRLEINANLTSIYRVDGEVKAVVTFDVFNTALQWNESDIINLNAIGKLIGQKVTQ